MRMVFVSFNGKKPYTEATSAQKQELLKLWGENPRLERPGLYHISQRMTDEQMLFELIFTDNKA